MFLKQAVFLLNYSLSYGAGCGSNKIFKTASHLFISHIILTKRSLSRLWRSKVAFKALTKQNVFAVAVLMILKIVLSTVI